MEVVYEATVESKTDIKKTLWQANIAFNYNGIELDEETGKVKPISFVVTDYRIKRLQDER
jgi:type IV secretory pathway component VirB8